jgi:hypothetical protein
MLVGGIEPWVVCRQTSLGVNKRDMENEPEGRGRRNAYAPTPAVLLFIRDCADTGDKLETGTAWRVGNEWLK